ncbi:hypothetical protein [Kitasatospora camelliae]|uniref:Bacteriocin-like protein n=1 Tax=Kitasatospora camelliae TaxID=3156397 RepID=A0AAU8JN18_9ACTN
MPDNFTPQGETLDPLPQVEAVETTAIDDDELDNISGGAVHPVSQRY